MPNYERATDSSLGGLITKYRLRQRHGAAAWSQLDLAVASETDQAHISRIENNLYHPQYATLVRICDALALSQTERAYILARAGYPVLRRLPDINTVQRVSGKLAPLLDSYPYPALLIDDGERIWYLNAAIVKLWGPCYGANDQQGCLPLFFGKRGLELIFGFDSHAPLLSVWRSYFEDFDELLIRIVALFWRAYRVRPQDAEMSCTLTRLKRYPVFLQLWQRIEAGETDVLYVEHAAYTLRIPTLGRLRFNCWRTHCGIDERFMVVHHTPVDNDTILALERLDQSTRIAHSTA